MDLTKQTLEQLKSLAYDQILLLNQAQNNVNILNAEIAKRQEKPEEDKKK